MLPFPNLHAILLKLILVQEYPDEIWQRGEVSASNEQSTSASADFSTSGAATTGLGGFFRQSADEAAEEVCASSNTAVVSSLGCAGR